MKNQTLTQERIDNITAALSDAKQAGTLTALGLDEAVGGFNALGYDFTKDELIAYGNLLKNNIELKDDALVGVAGGVGGDVEQDSWAVILGVFGVGREIGRGIGNIINNITGN